jgi:probable HAF family extracellular repeat protein
MLLGAQHSVYGQSLTWLGTLGGNLSVARGVSNDGSVVAGYSKYDNYNRAFRWTRAGGMQNLGTLPLFTYSEGYGISADGTKVVGTAFYVVPYGGSRRAFLWVAGSGMRDLGHLEGSPESSAFAISGDGSTVVGWGHTYRYEIRASRWTQGTGMQNLGTLGGNESRAFGVSYNGHRVVGWSYNPLRETWAFWWTAGGMQSLYPLAACCGEAKGISENGNIIVGRSHSAQTDRWHACMWWWNVSYYSPRDLGTLGGNESEALACTNTQIAVGWSHIPSGQRRAFRWTPTGGMEDLSSVYANLLGSGSYLEIAYAITPDGRYIVGQGYNAARARTEAFLLDTLCVAHNGDVDGNGCVDDADLLQVLFAFGNTGQGLGRVDVNCDGIVDDADLLQVLFNFGSGCS